MKLAIFGATGATGQCLVEQALDQGYDVTAFARNPLALTTRPAHLSIVTGAVFQKASVEEALANQDALLCTIGGDQRVPGAFPQCPRPAVRWTAGTRRILEAM